MKRAFTAAILAATLIATPASAKPQGSVSRFRFLPSHEAAKSEPASGRWRGPCSTWEYGESLTPATWAADPARGVRQIRRLIVCEFDRWAPGNASHALYIADRESSFYPWSRNASSGCEGLYQHIASAWPPRTRSYLWRGWFAPWTWTPAGQDPDPGAEPWSDARANVIVAARMVAAGGWGPWGG